MNTTQHNNTQRKVKVLVVDDAMSIRLLLQKIINAQPDMYVVGMAEHPLQAGEKLRELNPDVMTLDVEMPHMSGLTFLQKIMRLRPLPVVMISTRTNKGTEDAIRALEAGAVDVIGKPSQKISDISHASTNITNAIRAAAAARIGQHKPFQTGELYTPPADISELDKLLPLPSSSTGALPTNHPPLILLGASTGGTEAVQNVVANLPATLPPVLITQHMPAGAFTAAFARRLHEKSELIVVEAENRMPLTNGHAYVAPGGTHLCVKYQSGKYVCQLHDGPTISRHKPSVDCLFRSGLIAAGKNLSAAILTGMGEDGVKALREIKKAGGYTMAQDENTCVVYGMPKRAQEAGAVCDVFSPEAMAKNLAQRYNDNESIA